MNILDLASVLQPSWGRTIVRDGATDGDIDATERRIGVELPPALRAAYRLANGEQRATELVGESSYASHYAGLFFGQNFLSLEQLEISIAFWQELHETGDLGEPDPIYTSSPEGAVRAGVFNLGWLPFTEKSNERHVAFDNVPGVSGRVGQIINFGGDDFTRFVLAPNFAVLVDKLYDAYTQRRCHRLFADAEIDNDGLFLSLLEG